MPTSADIEFYRHREAQERNLAARAHHAEGRHAHLEMARCYALKIEEAQAALRLRPKMPG